VELDRAVAIRDRTQRDVEGNREVLHARQARGLVDLLVPAVVLQEGDTVDVAHVPAGVDRPALRDDHLVAYVGQGHGLVIPLPDDVVVLDPLVDQVVLHDQKERLRVG